ncbi:hypothetical protein CVT24_006449 [Panaeolus cyanescens]|uniref:Uncharacterized protein n=1 Tax=Panaeolus cyanescens TaxID=181874 RepID=A0A409X3I8_9AGAR|nr:hypothetical protein CVT24_006449 [Panaeolus cyanescens]
MARERKEEMMETTGSHVVGCWAHSGHPMSPVLANPAALSSFTGLSTSDSAKPIANVPAPLGLSSKPDPLLSTSFASPGSTMTSPRTSDMDALSPLNTLNAWSPGMVMGSVVSGRRVGEGEKSEGGRGIGAANVADTTGT